MLSHLKKILTFGQTDFSFIYLSRFINFIIVASQPMFWIQTDEISQICWPRNWKFSFTL